MSDLIINIKMVSTSKSKIEFIRINFKLSFVKTKKNITEKKT
jgi:hypothetical protein